MKRNKADHRVLSRWRHRHWRHRLALQRLEERHLLATVGPLTDLAGLSPIAIDSAQQVPVIAGDHVYFVGEDIQGQEEIWVLDRDATVAQPLVDPIYHPLIDRDPASLTAVGDQLFFVAAGVETGWSRQLHVTDATGESAIELTDVPELNGVASLNLQAGADQLFFLGNSDQHGQQVWVTDGTVAGTTRLTDLHYGGHSVQPKLFKTVGNRLYFMQRSEAGMELWISDGTIDGTELIRTTDAHGYTTSSRYPPFAFNDRLFFFESVLGSPYELWTSDGTGEGTHPFFEQEPTLAPRDLDNIVVAGDQLTFTSNDATNLWFSDGTEAGTRIVRSEMGAWFESVANGQQLYFQYTTRIDGQYDTTFGVSDGTPEGTLVFPDFADQLVLGTAMGTFDDRVILVRSPTVEDPSEWVITDGTDAGTVVLSDPEPEHRLLGSRYWTEDDGRAYFSRHFDYDRRSELWFTDGAALHPITVDRASSHPTGLTAAGDKFFFVADDGVNGRELWVTDAAYDASRRLTDFQVASDGSLQYLIDRLVVVGDKVYFAARTAPAWCRTLGQRWYCRGNTAGGRCATGLGQFAGPRHPEHLDSWGTGLLPIAERRPHSGERRHCDRYPFVGEQRVRSSRAT